MFLRTCVYATMQPLWPHHEIDSPVRTILILSATDLIMSNCEVCFLVINGLDLNHLKMFNKHKGLLKFQLKFVIYIKNNWTLFTLLYHLLQGSWCVCGVYVCVQVCECMLKQSGF